MKKFFASLLITVLATLSLAFIASPAQAGVPTKITYCQATASEKNPFNPITAAADSLIDKDGNLKQGGINKNDIVPPFEWDFGGSSHGSFAGQNWTAANQAFFANGCSAHTNVLTPPVPTFEPATCTLPTGKVTLNNTDERIIVNGPTLAGKTWTVNFDKVADTQYDNFSWVEGAVLNYTFQVTDPINDPLWDAEKGICRMPDTGFGGLSNEVLFLGLLAVGLGAAALTTSQIISRRKG